MRIGIITLPSTVNYGGILQAYALNKILIDLGYDAVHINKKEEKSFLYFLDAKLRFFIHKIIGNKPNWPTSKRAYKEIHDIQTKYTNQFRKKHIPQVTLDYNDLYKSNLNDFDVFIVGSDQVWRPKYVEDIYYYFLNFVTHGQKKIAYAASFGSDVWEFNIQQTNKCRKLLETFNFISVREESGVELCRKYFNCIPSHVLDPTMLLSSIDYLSLIEKNINNEPEGLMTYILDKNNFKDDIIKKFTQKNNCGLTSLYIGDNKSTIQPTPPIEDWIMGFNNAKYIITDSFHGVVFSILFKKPFLAIGNPDRGLSRFTSILKMFHLEDRLVISKKDLENKSYLLSIHNNINWDNLFSLLEDYKYKSLLFLTKSLEE